LQKYSIKKKITQSAIHCRIKVAVSFVSQPDSFGISTQSQQQQEQEQHYRQQNEKFLSGFCGFHTELIGNLTGSCIHWRRML